MPKTAKTTKTTKITKTTRAAKTSKIAAVERPVKYIEGIGGRKTSTARVRIYKKKGGIIVNQRAYKEYFPTSEMQRIIETPLRITKLTSKISVTALLKGGGIHSQAEALRHGLSRALIKHDPELRDALKKEGFLKRDPRMKERKKFGLHKARRAPQWSKR